MDLALEGLTLHRGGSGAPAALQQVDLAVRSGEAVAVVGPSGAGKSTLLEVAAAALRPSAGRVLLDGADPWAQGAAGLRALRRQLFLAPQVPPLPPRQRVVTAVLAGRLPQWSLWRSLRSLAYPIDLADAHAALLSFGLAEHLFDRVDRLSGGERQRVSLARGFLSNARLWLLDEPLSALDPARADAVIGAVRAEAARRGATLVASLHQVDLARAHFPRLVGLRAGRVVFDAPSAALDGTRLASLFEGAAATPDEPGDTPAEAAPPVRMHCR